MQDFIFENPTKIIFGRGQIKMIGPEVLRFGRKALLVYGRESIKKYGIYDQVTASLQGAGVSFVEFAGVKSNPVLSHVVKGIELARRENVKVILAVGGGSVIDSAKAIAAGVNELFRRRNTFLAFLFHCKTNGEPHQRAQRKKACKNIFLVCNLLTSEAVNDLCTAPKSGWLC